MSDVEVRAFMVLKQIFDQRGWSFPYCFKLEQECSGRELAEMLHLPVNQIEGVFVNGRAGSLDESRIRPGDRVAFVPPGTPGPHRYLLGIARMPAQADGATGSAGATEDQI